MPAMRSHLSLRVRRGLLPLGVLFAAIAVFALAEPHERPLSGDAALFTHYGHRVRAGEVPYRDFFDHKTPLVSYVNAALMSAGDLAGADEIVAMRAGYVLAGAGIALLLFLLGRALFHSSLAGMAAAIFFLGYSQTGDWVAIGSSPKLLMLCSGLFAWYAAFRGWAVLAGLAVGLSFMAWQPGGLFVAVACPALCWRGSGRRSRLVALLGSAAAPPAIFVAYLLVAGGLRDFYLQTVVFNRDYVRGGWGLDTAGGRLIDMQRALFADQRLVQLVAPAGMLLSPYLAFSARRGRAGPHGGGTEPTADSERGLASLGLYTVLAVGVSLANTGGHSDHILLMPAITLWPAAAVAAGQRAVATAWTRWRKAPRARLAAAATAAVLAGIAGYAFHDGIAQSRGSLANQRLTVEYIERAARLQPGDPVANLGFFPFGALTSYPNPVKYPYTYSDVPSFVAEHAEGAVAAYTEALARSRPKLVFYERQPSLALLSAWLEAHYVRCTNARLLRRAVDMRNHPVEVWFRPDVAQGNRRCSG